MLRKSIFICLIFVLLAVPLSVMGQDRSDTVILVEVNDPQNFNPILALDGASRRVVQVLWPFLFQNDPMTGLAVNGGGLTTWEISEDGLTYTFTIREDALWSDGSPITAQDVKFTYEAGVSDLVESTVRGQLSQIASINIVDDQTFEIVLNSVNCAFFSDLSNIPILPASRYAADFSDFNTSDFNTTPDIAGGPYVLTEWLPDEFIRFTANPNYFGGVPKIANLIIRPIADPTITIQALQAGEIDYATLNAAQLEQLGDQSNLNISTFAANSILAFSMNWADPANPQAAYAEDGSMVEQTPHPIFSDLLVRQAIALGIDKDAIVTSLGEGGGVRTPSFVAPSITWAFNNALDATPYDPARAAELLDEAGWVLNETTGIREKDGQPLKFDFVFTPADPAYEPVALIAQDQLTQLGMDVTLNSQDGSVWLGTVLGQAYDMTVFSWGGGPEPNVWAPFMTSTLDIPNAGFNHASYINPQADELIKNGLSLPGCDSETRGDIYKELQQMLHDDVAYDFIYATTSNYVVNKRVQNFNPGPWYRFSADVNQWTLSE